MKSYFIINPAAGKSDAGNMLIPEIERYFSRHPGFYEIYHTSGVQDAEHFVCSRCHAPENEGMQLRFYACGGDGTAREVASGTIGFENAAFGVFPRGSGNDFIRNFPGHNFSSIEAQLNGSILPIDAFRCNGMLGINICNIGLDAEVADNMTRFKRLPFVNGSMAYNLSVLSVFFRKMGAHAHYQSDYNAPFEKSVLLTVIANGKFYGGNYMGAPRANLSDGQLDLCIVPKISRLRIPLLLGKYKRGLHFEDKLMKKLILYKNASLIQIAYDRPVTMAIDGECSTVSQVEVHILPHALRLVLPEPEKKATYQSGSHN